MEINIQPWISTRTDCINETSYVSLIYSAKYKVYYLLIGQIAQLWDFIVSSLDFEKIQKYAIEKNLNEDLIPFLSELQQNNIIKTNTEFKFSEKKYLKNAISTQSKNAVYFYQKWLDIRRGQIMSLHMELNYNCNLKCKHCYNHKDMNEYEITYEQAKKIIDDAYSIGLYSVALSGGECTINKDFLKIAKYIKEKHLELHILTNGQRLYDDNNLFNEIVKLYPARVKISLYSMDEKLHDYITGVEGSHYKTINVINNLRKNGIKVVIATPILSYNKDCYKEVAEYAKEIGLHFNYGNIFINNPKNNNIEARADMKTIEDYYFETFDITKLRCFEKNNNQICNGGNERICVTPKLDITPCAGVDYAIGNLKTRTLKEIKENELVEFRKNFITENLKECFKYEYCKFCKYCPDIGTYNNSFMKKSPIHCDDAKAYYKAYLYYKEKEEYEQHSQI